MEIWKDIKGYENVYQVSTYGNVRSLDNTKNRKEKVLKSNLSRGYSKVDLYKNGIKKTFKIHRLVAETFIKNQDSKETVNHINGIKTDNRVENLEWATCRENTQHAIINGLQDIKINKSKRLINQYDLKGNFIKQFLGIGCAERSMGFSRGGISKCCRGSRKTAYGYVWRYAELERKKAANGN